MVIACRPRRFSTVTHPFLRSLLQDYVVKHVSSVYPEMQDVIQSAIVTPSAATQDSACVDYQTNVAFRIASATKKKPAEVATALAAVMSSYSGSPSEPVARVTASGQGFLNIQLSEEFLSSGITHVASNGVPNPKQLAGRHVLVDFASPNVGKELHVGHLRSAVIGDTLSRLLEYCGADVERVSHVGDLGLPVALVMAAMEAVDTSPQLASQVLSTPYRTGDSPSPSQLSELYVFAKATVGDGVASRQSLADNADALAAHATQEESQTLSSRFRARVSALLLDIQKGSHAQCATRVLWTRLVSASQRGYNALFHRLDVKVVERGESTYVDDLPSVVAALKANGSAVFSDGAWVVPLGGAPKVPPVVIQKRDGGFLYATIDVAAIKCRLDAGFSHLIYVTDSSQSLHFTSLFQLAEEQGWARPSSVKLSHAHFGLVLGADGRKLSSREGVELSLEGLLDAGVEAARTAFTEKGWKDLDHHTLDKVACSAIRYFDLAHLRTKNYVFSFDHVLSFKGNSAVFLMYAIARLSSLRGNVAVELGLPQDASWRQLMVAAPINTILVVTEPLERELAVRILQIPDVVSMTVDHLTPHVLCDHVFGLAQTFHAFYNSCRVGGHPRRSERIVLCAAADCALRTCLQLLGVYAPDKL